MFPSRRAGALFVNIVLCIPSLFELYRANVAGREVSARRVVESFDVIRLGLSSHPEC